MIDPDFGESPSSPTNKIDRKKSVKIQLEALSDPEREYPEEFER